MNVILENIGIIKKADIQLNGMTVITGYNDSGKSTLGKALYSYYYGKNSYLKNLHKDAVKYSLSPLRKIMISDAQNLYELLIDTDKSFFYADPPYLITCATYNEQDGWTEKDERDLLELLDKLNERGIKFALSNVTIHKGKRNEILIDWSRKYNVHNLSFSYNNSNYHGTNTEKETQEVLITNY